VSALRTLFTAASASGLLPWILCGLLAAFSAIGSAGFYAGHRWAASACAADIAASNLAAAQHQAQAVAKAQAASDKLWAIGLDLQLDLTVLHQRAATRITEVIRHVDATPSLASARVPAAVQRLRDEQAADSATIAAGRPVRR
jgi:hypothetical protein